MRSLVIFIFAFVFVCPPAMALTPAPAPAGQSEDAELWTALNDLHKRFRVTEQYRAGRVGAVAFLVPTAAGVIGMLLAESFEGWIISRAVGLLGGVSALSFTIVSVGALSADVRSFPREGLMLGTNDPEQFGQKSLIAFRKFLKKPVEKQFEIARAAPELRAYLIELDRWITEGVMNAPPPAAIQVPN